MAAQQLPLIKCSVLHYRDKSHDEETWLKWYNEEQIPRFIPIAHKHGIDKVEIVRLIKLSLETQHTMSYPSETLG